MNKVATASGLLTGPAGNAAAGAHIPLFCSAVDAAKPLAPVMETDGRVRLEFETDAPGLYQCAVILDGRDFDWESLYLRLNCFKNSGQRTGPWDFNFLDHNNPLVPSYWVFLDGNKLGLWYCQRISLEDLAAKRFRGRLAFHLAQGGRHILEFAPFRPVKVSWLATVIEVDPEDRLERLSFNLENWATRCPAGQWADAAYWENLRLALATTHALYREPLRRMRAWLLTKVLPPEKRSLPPDSLKFDSEFANYPPEDILPLLALYRLEGRADALAAILKTVDRALALPHWGNPQEGAYGCDGDMGAASALRALAWLYRALGAQLGDERCEKLREKLRLQGSRFFSLLLLNRDYWGGAVLQDHGARSMADFGAAVLHLLGVLPEAELWAAYIVPRNQRTLAAAPRDGVVPLASYQVLYLYTDAKTYYRNALLALTGEDIYAQTQFHKVVDFLCAVLREKDLAIFASHGIVLPFIGGNSFLNIIASIFRDHRAAYLQQLMLQVPEFAFFHGTQENAYYYGALDGLLTYDPTVPAQERLPETPALAFFQDSGLAYYRDRRADVTLAVQCGPWCGYNAYRRAPGPCDRLEVLAGAGHFNLAIGNTPMLVSPDSGYRLQAALRTCLLVDNQGPIGDIGYPMSIPSFRDRGEEILFARWDETARNGWVRLNLAPAYPEQMGMAWYTRDFLLYEGERIVCRDQVVLSRPGRLSWLFQGAAENGLELEEKTLACVFGRNPRLRVKACPVGTELRLAKAKTEVVYSYASMGGFKSFVHARFDSPAPAAAVVVDFVLTWHSE